MAAERTWTTVGEQHIGRVTLEGGEVLTRAMVEAAINELDWVDVVATLELPAMPGYTIRETIEQLSIPKVDKIAWCCRATDDPDFDERYPLAPYGFYGIEGNYSNGRARIYVLDLGGLATPLCTELFTEEEETAHADA